MNIESTYGQVPAVSVRRAGHVGRWWRHRGFLVVRLLTSSLQRLTFGKQRHILFPEGPSTQYLRSMVPKTIPLMVFGTRVLNYGVLGPSGHILSKSLFAHTFLELRGQDRFRSFLR